MKGALAAQKFTLIELYIQQRFLSGVTRMSCPTSARRQQDLCIETFSMSDKASSHSSSFTATIFPFFACGFLQFHF
jgi:hypothetical protein